MTRGIGVLAVCLLVGGLLVGCNVFEGLGTGAESVDSLLADARSALSAGEPSKAVALLERAFDKDSTDVRVRVELGNAIYAARDLDLFVVRDLAGQLVSVSDSAQTSSSVRSGDASGSVCSGGVQPDSSTSRYARVHLDADPVQRLVEQQGAIDRVRTLVVEGVLARRSAALSESAVQVRRKALLVAAATRLMREVIGLRSRFADASDRLFYDREPSPDGAFVACTGSEGDLAEHEQSVCALGTAAGQAVDWLERRGMLSGTDRTGVLLARLRQIRGASQAGRECTAHSSSVASFPHFAGISDEPVSPRT